MPHEFDESRRRGGDAHRAHRPRQAKPAVRTDRTDRTDRTAKGGEQVSGALPGEGRRLAKFLADAGVASRRKCEELIVAGQVTVNGEAVLTPAFKVPDAGAEVCVNGKRVAQAEKVYLVFNKPAGYTCTAADPHAEHIVFEILPKNYGRLFTVGRLDRDSEGLLLVTNDGDWAQTMAHPSNRTERSYYVECEGNFTTEIRRRLLEGIHDDGEFLKPVDIREVRHLRGHCELEFLMVEGKKREVRRLCQAVGLEVTLLRRVSFGPYRLGELPIGRWRKLSAEEIRQK